MSGDFRLPPIRRPGRDPEPVLPPDTNRQPDESGRRKPPEQRPFPNQRPALDEEPTERPSRPDRRPADRSERHRSRPDRPPADPSEPDTRRRSGPEYDRQHDRTREPEPERTPHERPRPTGRQAEPETNGRRSRADNGEDVGGRGGENPHTFGPWITVTGRLLREPQSSERPKPSPTPVVVALVLLGICVLFPYVIAYIGYVVVGAIVLIILVRKLRLNMGGGGWGARPNQQEKPRIMVTTLRIGVPKPDDPRSFAREFSCRLLTRQRDGAVEVAGGDSLRIRGRLDGAGLIHVRDLTVASTGSRIAAAAGASAAPVLVATLLLVALSGGALWMNRGWLSPDVLHQAVDVVKGSVIHLAGLVLIVVIIWFAIKKMIFRR